MYSYGPYVSGNFRDLYLLASDDDLELEEPYLGDLEQH